VAAPVLLFALDASLAGQLDDRQQEERLARHGVALLDQLRKEIKRVHRRTDSHNNTALPTQKWHDDLAPDTNGHERPFLTSYEICINTTKTFIFSTKKTKEKRVSTEEGGKRQSESFFF
jgi:hypothetical protein